MVHHGVWHLVVTEDQKVRVADSKEGQWWGKPQQPWQDDILLSAPTAMGWLTLAQDPRKLVEEPCSSNNHAKAAHPLAPDPDLQSTQMQLPSLICLPRTNESSWHREWDLGKVVPVHPLLQHKANGPETCTLYSQYQLVLLSFKISLLTLNHSLTVIGKQVGQP